MSTARKILDRILDLFSLPRRDYSRHLVLGGANGLMRDNWRALEDRLGRAMSEVREHESYQQVLRRGKAPGDPDEAAQDGPSIG